MSRKAIFRFPLCCCVSGDNSKLSRNNFNLSRDKLKLSRATVLKDILVKAKLRELKAIITWVESVSQASLYHVICCKFIAR